MKDDWNKAALQCHDATEQPKPQRRLRAQSSVLGSLEGIIMFCDLSFHDNARVITRRAERSPQSSVFMTTRGSSRGVRSILRDASLGAFFKYDCIAVAVIEA